MSKYNREIYNAAGQCITVDVYDVLTAFNVTNPAAAHAVKKLLCAGLRGHKGPGTDYTEAADACRRAAELVTLS